MAYESAENVQDEEGRQYHIGLAPGEVAEWVLLVGDPGRAERAAKLLDSVRLERRNREYVAVTGSLGNLEVTILGTGIGSDNTEIAIVELLRCQPRPTLIRVGSCGSLKPEVGLTELVISTGAVRLESTSLAFVEEGYPAFAHHEVVLALISAAEERGSKYHTGVTATAAGFYGWQGRTNGPLETRFPDMVERLQRMKVTNLEMETSTLFTLATLAGLRSGTVCTVFANRTRNAFIDPKDKAAAEEDALRVGLSACEYLARMDAEAGGKPFHLTSQKKECGS